VGFKAIVALIALIWAAAGPAISMATPVDTGQQYLSEGCADGADRDWCEIQRKQFLKWYPSAHRGDYQSQRNVALCLFDGCGGAIIKNQVTACAWRMIILAGGSMRVDSSDTANMKLCRERLSADEWLAVSGQVQTLSSKVRR
jgi:hypothetical protein